MDLQARLLALREGFANHELNGDVCSFADALAHSNQTDSDEEAQLCAYEAILADTSGVPDGNEGSDPA